MRFLEKHFADPQIPRDDDIFPSHSSEVAGAGSGSDDVAVGATVETGVDESPNSPEGAAAGCQRLFSSRRYSVEMYHPDRRGGSIVIYIYLKKNEKLPP